MKPPQESLRNFPEEARIIFFQWDSLVLQDGVMYRRYHYPDGTTRYLQVVIPAKLRHPYVERFTLTLALWTYQNLSRASVLSVLSRLAFADWNFGSLTAQHATYVNGITRSPGRG